MKQLTALLIFLLLPLTIIAQDTWVHDQYHSNLGFTVTHLGIADVPGHFGEYSVSITASEEDFSDAQIELTVQTATVNTRVQDRDDHLRSEDFFHVEQYPEMTFSSRSIRTVEEGVFELTGDLTLLDVTREVTMTMVHRGTVENPMADGAPVAGIQISGTIDRSEFNLGNGFPPPMISNNVEIKADGEFVIQ
ncbi:polyisoprenoid-binding protein [Rhodohalobacter sp. SW132]|uniref:YceI family protein n=1 Tax=Rhodohalobacter sp. SW132 TaxID=2293433 RepID=UPI000E2633B1|nr:YceI family protein [Rhodohalobacter sp. SW132]REL38243.1 polyisoprenoid-binding protein [Rhodohalobacter sp. SW132]